MWERDLIREMIESIQRLPEQLGEVIARQPANAAGGNGTERLRRGPGSQENKSLYDLAKNLEGVIGGLGRLGPGLGGLTGTLGKLKNALADLNKVGGGLGAVGSAAVEGVRSSRSKPFPESGHGPYRYPDVDEVARARLKAAAALAETAQQRQAPHRETFKKLDLSGEFLRAFYSGRKLRPGFGEDVARLSRESGQQATTKPAGFAGPALTGILAGATPAFLRRYKSYGSLPGSEDKLGKMFDNNPLLRDILFAGVNSNGMGQRLLGSLGSGRRSLGGGRGGSGGGNGGPGSGAGDFFPPVPRGGPLSRLSRESLADLAARAMPTGPKVRVVKISTDFPQQATAGPPRQISRLATAAQAAAAATQPGDRPGGFSWPSRKALAGTVSALAGVGTALWAFNKASESVLPSQRHFAAVNPQYAAMFAGLDASKILRDQQIANRTIGTSRFLASQSADLQDALIPQKSVTTKISNLLASSWTGLKRGIADQTGPLFKSMDESDVWDRAQKGLARGYRAAGNLLAAPFTSAHGWGAKDWKKWWRDLTSDSGDPKPLYDTTVWGAWMEQVSKDALKTAFKPAGYVP